LKKERKKRRGRMREKRDRGREIEGRVEKRGGRKERINISEEDASSRPR